MSDISETNVLVNIANSLLPVQELVTGAGYLIGIGFAIKALMTLKQQAETKSSASGQSGSGIKEPFLYFIIAGFLIYLPTGFEVLMKTSFGYTSVLAYGESSTLDSIFGDNELGAALVTIVQTIGVFAFVKGFVLLARASSQGQQPGGTGKGMMHIFGGILAINVVGTIEMVNNTLFGNG